MKVTTNKDFSVVDFEDGKLLTNVIDLESYYVDLQSYEIIERCRGEVLDVKQLNFHKYSEEDFLEFIFYLIKENILLEVGE